MITSSKPLGMIICWLKGKHRRGVPCIKQLSDGGYRTFCCPRCGREKRYRVKPKSADVLQIPVSRT